MIRNCEMCNREMDCNEHHLIPKTNHKNKWFKKVFTLKEMTHRRLWTCYDCHSAIHRLIPDEKVLGRDYNTKELLMSHPEINKFVKWVGKQQGKVKKIKS